MRPRAGEEGRTVRCKEGKEGGTEKGSGGGEVLRHPQVSWHHTPAAAGGSETRDDPESSIRASAVRLLMDPEMLQRLPSHPPPGYGGSGGMGGPSGKNLTPQLIFFFF